MTTSDISAEAIHRQLHTQFVGRRLIYLASATSTMDVARLEAERGALEGTTVVADEQTAGRGRLHRTWVSPPGSGLYVSIVFRPELAMLPQVTMMASLAMAHTVERATGLTAALKWPNDVFIRGKKVCGIIIESDVQGAHVNWIILGIGLNVNLDASLYPEIASFATSLSTEAGHPLGRQEVLVHLLEEVEAHYLALKQGQPLHKEWARRLFTLGQEVTVTWGDRKEEGLAQDVDEDGALILRRKDGTTVRILAGDVTLRT